MPPMPQAALIILSALPLLGLGMLAVALLSLAANRDRWILPGVIVILLAATAWGAAMEYGGQVKQLIASRAATHVARVETPAPLEPAPPEPSPRPRHPAAQPLPKPRPADEGPHWVPITNRAASEPGTERSGRRIVVVNPVTAPARPRREPSSPRTSRTPPATSTPRPATPPPNRQRRRQNRQRRPR